MLRLALCLFAGLGIGCGSCPGFRASWEYYHPPSVKAYQILSPMPTAPTTTYAVEANGGIPLAQRQYYLASPPAAVPMAPPSQPMPVRQMLPMPKENIPVPTPCGPGGGCCE